MARIANLDKNPRVAHYSVSGDKYKSYNVTLTGTFYRKVYRGDSVHCFIHGEARIKALQEQIDKLESRQPEEFAVTTCSIGSSTLTGAHEQVNALLSRAGWYQYRAGMIDVIRDEIKQEEERVKERNKSDREEATYNFKEGWKGAILTDHAHRFCGLEDWEIVGICGRTTKAVANHTMTVSDWKEREMKRLKGCLEKLTVNISMMESLDVEEVQKWMDGLRNDAKEYIETAIKHEYE